VNGLSRKHDEIKELLRLCKLDLLVLSETKLDGSYQQGLLKIDGYESIRQDKRSNSGGIMIYITKEIPFNTFNINVFNDDIESLSIEMTVGDQKILLIGVYKNPKMEVIKFRNDFEEMCETAFNKHENVIIIGDMNFNMFNDNALSAMLPTFGLTNVIKEATCFKSENPTLIDVMLSSKRRKILKGFSCNTGISDYHNLIGGVLRAHKPVPRIKKVAYRQLSKIDYDTVNKTLKNMDLSKEICSWENVETAFSKFHDILHNIINKHAPLKTKIIRRNNFHCMTRELRKAILVRNQLRNKYYRYRTNRSLLLYRHQRNKVTAIKRKEINKYFKDKCKMSKNNKEFWKVIKPFFSKSKTETESIVLREDDKIVNDDKIVCNIFNTFFQNIGYDIGTPEDNNKPLGDIINSYKHHDSIEQIKKHINSDGRRFILRFITEREVRKIIKSLASNKASGYDDIPVKFIKNIARSIAHPMTQLINRSIQECVFPSRLKKANITPVYKKKDKLNKDNFRSVNILPILSKVIERVMYKQMYDYMTSLFHCYLSGFREGHGCQDLLLKMTEDLKESLDYGHQIGVVAIDLSKAFDCMPHGLLLAKLSAYGFDINSLRMLKSYIMNREQRVKIGTTYSDWVSNIKGVPQGSILGPLLFNIFINDFLFSNFHSKIYNYADDNTLCCTDINIENVKSKLEQDCLTAVKWFKNNNMKANATKFQLMFLSRNDNLNDKMIMINEIEIQSSESINVLGMELDRQLKYSCHVDETGRKIGKQVNALKRINHFLSKDSKNTIYNSYINCSFTYCSVVWMFTGVLNIEKLEKTNKRALRLVANNYTADYKQICEHEKQLNIYRKCVKAAAVLMYKITNGMSPNYLSDLFKKKDSKYSMRDNNKYILPRFNTVTYGKKSFRYFGAWLWNNIPADIKASSSINTFKVNITDWLITCSENCIKYM